MGFLEKVLSVLEKWEEGQDEYWERREQYRKEFIEKYGFPPLDVRWCKTNEINAKIRRAMRKRWKESVGRGEQDEN